MIYNHIYKHWVHKSETTSESASTVYTIFKILMLKKQQQLISILIVNYPYLLKC